MMFAMEGLDRDQPQPRPCANNQNTRDWPDGTATAVSVEHSNWERRRTRIKTYDACLDLLESFSTYCSRKVSVHVGNCIVIPTRFGVPVLFGEPTCEIVRCLLSTPKARETLHI